MKVLNKISILFLTLSFSLIIVKVFVGLDFTDELQYYGQILSLLNHERLFAEDLFIQQFVYIFYLPFFKIFRWLNPDLIGLVLFARFCLFFTIVINIILIIKMLSIFSRPSIYFACAFILFAITDKIFAISYGSLALILSTLIIALYLSQKHFISKNLFSAFLCVILCFCHPSFGICLIFVWFGLNLYDKENGLIYFTVCFSTTGSIIFGILFFSSYLDLEDFLNALNFTSKYNNAIILKMKYDMQILGIYWLLSTALTFFVDIKRNNLLNLGTILENKSFPLLTLTISVSFTLYFWNSFYSLQSYIFYYISFILTITLSPTDTKTRSLFLKLLWGGTFTGTVIAITSGNGLQAFSQGVVIFSPFLLLILVDQIKVSTPIIAPTGLIFTTFILSVSATWAIRHPYRDQRLPNLTHELEYGSIFSGLKVSQTKKTAITWLNESFGGLGIEDGQSALVIGGHPWIYFGSDLEPSTPVTFMHFRAKSGAFEIIAEEISSSPAPEVIILAEQPPPNIADSVHNLLKKNVYKTYELIPPLNLQENLFNEIHYKLESPLIIHRLIK
jgi:hypothetical protein